MRFSVALATFALGAVASSPPELRGAEYVLQGVDMLGASSTGCLADCVKPLPIFQTTYSAGTTFTNPISGEVYSVPDQVSASVVNVRKMEQLDSDVATFDDYWKSETKKWGISITVCPIPSFHSLNVSASYSSQSYQFYEHVHNYSQHAMTGHVSWNYWSVESFPPELLTLHPMVNSFLTNLDKESDLKNHKVLADYTEFIQYFGTHAVGQVSVGAEIHANGYMNASFDSSHKESWKQAEWSVSVGCAYGSIGGWGAKNSSWGQLSHDWQHNVGMNSTVTGGDTSIYQGNDTLVEWEATTAKMPAAISFPVVNTLAHVAELHKFATASKNLDIVIGSYLKNAGNVKLMAEEIAGPEAARAVMARLSNGARAGGIEGTKPLAECAGARASSLSCFLARHSLWTAAEEAEKVRPLGAAEGAVPALRDSVEALRLRVAAYDLADGGVQRNEAARGLWVPRSLMTAPKDAASLSAMPTVHVMGHAVPMWLPIVGVALVAVALALGAALMVVSRGRRSAGSAQVPLLWGETPADAEAEEGTWYA